MLHRYNPGDKAEVIKTIDWIDYLYNEYCELWNNKNYDFGRNVFANKLTDRQMELKQLIK